MKKPKIIQTNDMNCYKKNVTILLALAGIGAMAYYATCRDSCAYLAGDIAGIDLKYIGIAFMVAVIASSATGLERMLRIMLAGGIGGEIFLIGYQIKEGTFCPYCLFFAVMLILAFLVNYRRPEKKLTYWAELIYALGEISFQRGKKTETVPLSVFTLSCLLLFFLLFAGATVPAYAEEVRPVVYGSGPVEIRIYSDYFCAPCQKVEPEMERIVDSIINGKKARVLFIDTPIHKETALYARYFCYATNKNLNYERAVTVRRILFDAAREKVRTEGELLSYLKARGIQAPNSSTTIYFKILSQYLKNDRITSTPTCVIIFPNEKVTYRSTDAILSALQNIAKQ